jgi:hypothetical protein
MFRMGEMITARVEGDSISRAVCTASFCLKDIFLLNVVIHGVNHLTKKGKEHFLCYYLPSATTS